MAIKGPTERTRTITRDATVDVSGFTRSLQNIGNFFGQIGTDQAKAQQRKVEKENVGAINKLALQIEQDFPAAREAARSGDLTPFMDEELSSRVDIQSAAGKLIGERSAARAKDDFQVALSQQEANIDPHAFAASWLKEQTEGMQGASALSFQTTFQKYADKMIGERHKALVDDIKTATLASVESDVKDQIETNQITNYRDLSEYRNSVAFTMPGTSRTKALILVQDKMDRALLRVATTHANPAIRLRTMKMMDQVDPRLKSSANDRLITDRAGLINSFISEQSAILTTTGKANMERLRNGAAQIKAGQSEKSYKELYHEGIALMKNETNIHLNPEFNKWVRSLFEGTKDDAVFTDIVRQWKVGDSGIPVTNKARNAILDSPEKYGLNPEDIPTFVSQMGASPKIKQRIETGLRQGNRDTISMVDTIIAAPGHIGLKDLVDSEEAKVMYWVGKDTTSETEFEERRQAVTEGLKANDGKVLGAFTRLWNTGQLKGLDDDARGLIGQRGIRDKWAEVWNNMSEEQAKFLGFDGKPDFDTLNRGVVAQLGRFMDVATISLSDSADATIENITARAISMMKGQYENARTTAGDTRVVLRQTPRVTKDPIGQTTKVKPFGKDELAEVKEYFEDDHTRPLLGTGFGGIEPDTWTKLGKGQAVMHSPDQLGPRPFTIPLATHGQPIHVTREYFDAYLKGVVGDRSPFRVISDLGDNGVNIEVTPPVADAAPEVVFDQNMSLMYDPQMLAWRQRWTPSLTFKDTGFKDILGNALRSIGLAPKILDQPLFNFETLPEASRKRVHRRIEKTIPLFWTDERLRGFMAAGTRPGSLMRERVMEEIERRKLGGPPGDIEEFIRNQGRAR